MDNKVENKLIEWTIDDVFGELKRISLVSEPAIEQDFMLFNGIDLQFQTVDEKKKIVTGCAMRPNINIPRKDEAGNLYYGFFSEDTVNESAQLFFKRNSNANNTNLEHQFEVDGVFVFESWIVENPEMDKAKALGFNDVKKGDWWVSMKIENDFIWNNYLKTGLIRGFSVEIRAKENDVQLSEINDIIDSDASLEVKWNSIIELLK